MSSPPVEPGSPAPSDADVMDRAASLGDAPGLASASPAELPAVELDIWKLALMGSDEVAKLTDEL